MRFRVVAQFIAVVLIMIFFTLTIRGQQIVILNKIYTKTGDDGTTALGNGERTRRAQKRVSAYGSVDELNSSSDWQDLLLNQINCRN